MLNYEENVEHVERLLQKEEYTDSATRCMIVLEQVLRSLVTHYLDSTDDKTGAKFQEAVRKRDRSGEGFKRLTMGQVVHVFRESKYLEAVALSLGKDLSSLQVIDLEKLTRLRNKFAHEGHEASRTEAEFLLNCLKIVLEKFDLTSKEPHFNTGGLPMKQLFTHGYALLIGVGDTAEPKWSLPVTVKDVQAIHRILIDPTLCAYPNNDAHVRLLCNTDATRQAILDGLAWLKQQAENDPDATIVVYYSGHGWTDIFNNRYALIPHDFNSSDLANSTLSAENFSGALREIAAKRLLVFVDSCHAEGMATAKNEPELPADFMKTGLPKGIIDSLKQGEGRAVFTSSRGKQRSWVRPDNSMSLYTYHLIEALQGAGNRPGDTEVKVSNLMNHLGESVPESARTLCKAEQTPFFDAATEDFSIAMLRGGKGLPANKVTTSVEDTESKEEKVVIDQTAGDNAMQFGQVHGDVNIQR